MSVWQQAVIDFAESGPREAAMCAEAESFARERMEQPTWGSEEFYELTYRTVMARWSEAATTRQRYGA